ncbi:General control protein [Elasticomyces elasticus]|nr:General control protein [Elasticomyces elasticus]
MPRKNQAPSAAMLETRKKKKEEHEAKKAAARERARTNERVAFRSQIANILLVAESAAGAAATPAPSPSSAGGAAAPVPSPSLSGDATALVPSPSLSGDAAAPVPSPSPDVEEPAAKRPRLDSGLPRLPDSAPATTNNPFTTASQQQTRLPSPASARHPPQPTFSDFDRFQTAPTTKPALSAPSLDSTLQLGSESAAVEI